ncbi:MAG: DUF2071 domain-containing protein [Bacteroidota bacterium]
MDRPASGYIEADKSLLQKYIPYKTELNDWNGKYYISLLGFIFNRPVIAGIPSPFYRRFEEINLRFYVRHKTGNEWKNGVVFINEIAPSPIIGLVARWLYHETLPVFLSNTVLPILILNEKRNTTGIQAGNGIT